MDRSFLRLMTYNVQGLYNPLAIFSGDTNQKADAEKRVRIVAEAIRDLKDDAPDILCLNEILFSGAADIFKDVLSNEDDDYKPYPYWAWAAFSDGADAAVAASALGAVGALIGGVPGAAVGATLGAVFEGIYTRSGGSAGIMIFSRHRFIEFPKIERSSGPRLRHFTEETEDGDQPFSVLVGEYSDGTGDDDFARKGFLMVKIRTPFGDPIHVLGTHLQAAYDDGDDCADRHDGAVDVHDNLEGCGQHADVRRSQVDEIVRALRDAGLDDDAWKRTIVTGDLNIRGEPDRRTFVTPDDLSEVDSIFDPDEADRFPEEGFQEQFDGWAAHTKPKSGYWSRNLVDPGFSNFNMLSEGAVTRGQRLDYIVYPRDPSFELAPHVMLNRFRGSSDHRSVEAHFGRKADWCQPSAADDVTTHAPASEPNHLWLRHAPSHGDRVDRYDWTFMPMARKRRGLYFRQRLGTSPGTYAIAGALLDPAKTLTNLPVTVFTSDNLTDPATSLRTIKDRLTSPEIRNEHEGYKWVQPSEEQVHGFVGPIYLRMRVPMQRTAFVSIRRLMGETPEEAIETPAWFYETTPWQTAAASGGSAHERWYRVAVRRHSCGRRYPCRFVFENQGAVKVAVELRQADAPQTAVVGDDGQPIAVSGDGDRLTLDWTAPEDGGAIFVKLTWDPSAPVAKGRVRFEPELTGFGDGHGDENKLLFGCVKETPGIGSDEMLVRIYADGVLWQVMRWDDVDSGEKLATPTYEAMLKRPVWFEREVTIEFAETGDVTGRQYGKRTLTRLTDAESKAVNEVVKVDDGAGVYAFSGMLFRYVPER